MSLLPTHAGRAGRATALVLFALWALVPPSAWALCVASAGHVELEMARTAVPIGPLASPAVVACEDAEDCPPAACHDCVDLALGSLPALGARADNDEGGIGAPYARSPVVMPGGGVGRPAAVAIAPPRLHPARGIAFVPFASPCLRC